MNDSVFYLDMAMQPYKCNHRSASLTSTDVARVEMDSPTSTWYYTRITSECQATLARHNWWRTAIPEL